MCAVGTVTTRLPWACQLSTTTGHAAWHRAAGHCTGCWSGAAEGATYRGVWVWSCKMQRQRLQLRQLRRQSRNALGPAQVQVRQPRQARKALHLCSMQATQALTCGRMLYCSGAMEDAVAGTLDLSFAAISGVLGTCFSMLIRVELAQPGNQVLQTHRLCVRAPAAGSPGGASAQPVGPGSTSTSDRSAVSRGSTAASVPWWLLLTRRSFRAVRPPSRVQSSSCMPSNILQHDRILERCATTALMVMQLPACKSRRIAVGSLLLCNNSIEHMPRPDALPCAGFCPRKRSAHQGCVWCDCTVTTHIRPALAQLRSQLTACRGCAGVAQQQAPPASILTDCRPAEHGRAQPGVVLHLEHASPYMHVCTDIFNTGLRGGITRAAVCCTAQLVNAHIDVKGCVRHGNIHFSAQRAAHAAQSCDVVQLLIELPGVLFQVVDDAAEHIRRQAGDRAMRRYMPFHDDVALPGKQYPTSAVLAV
jgi:hypothetical protein